MPPCEGINEEVVRGARQPDSTDKECVIQIGATYRKNDNLEFVFEHRSVQLYAGLTPGGYPRLQSLLEPYSHNDLAEVKYKPDTILYAASLVFKNKIYLSGGTQVYHGLKSKSNTYGVEHVWSYEPTKKIWYRAGMLKGGRMKHTMALYQDKMVVIGGVSKISYKYSSGCVKKFTGVHYEGDLQGVEVYKNERQWEHLDEIDECIPKSAFDSRRATENNPDAVTKKVLYRYGATSATWNENVIIAGNSLLSQNKIIKRVLLSREYQKSTQTRYKVYNKGYMCYIK